MRSFCPVIVCVWFGFDDIVLFVISIRYGILLFDFIVFQAESTESQYYLAIPNF